MAGPSSSGSSASRSPPVQLQVLSPIDVPAFGMAALDPLHVPEETRVAHGEVPGGFEAARSFYDLNGDVGAAAGWIFLAIVVGLVLALIAVGFFLGRVTA